MPREHWNDIPGDISAGDAENLPGGFGTDNPDNSTDATIDEIVENDVLAPDGTQFASREQQGGDTAGTSYAEGVNTGSTIDPNELIEGEEAHPGAGVGFTGGESDKTVTPEAGRQHEEDQAGGVIAGGTDEPGYTSLQREILSVETEGPVGGQGAAGTIKPSKGKKAA